jgi:hypothetical protein
MTMADRNPTNFDPMKDFNDLSSQPETAIQAAGGLARNMTLRDHFAGEADGIDAEVDDRYAGRFNADEKPPKDDWLAWAKWFAKADATLRYIRADAMLEARKTTEEGGMTITAAIIHGAIIEEQRKRHPVDQAYLGPGDAGYSDYLFDGKMNLDRVAEIINETMTTTETKP